MKIIDLLNKIANREEVPKKIHYNCVPLYWCEPCKIYETMTDGELCGKDLYTLLDNLNDEVEILEEKKIPEKLKILNANEHSKEVYYENYSKEEISLDIETLQNWVNKIIDYLKSKGE